MTEQATDRSTGNTARFAARPLSHGGTPAHAWLTAGLRLPVVDLADCGEILLVAAHPDDETLGLGATATMLARRGARVQVVSVTDGGASHPGLSSLQRLRLEHTRRSELRRATERLGLAAPIHLGLPDGDVGRHEARLTDLLVELLAARPAGTWCAANWRGDGHPDHEATGRAAAAAAEVAGAALVEYPVWMWHWASPGDRDVPWQRACRVGAPDDAVARKRWAAQSYRSQFEAIDGAPVLPPFVLRRLLAVGEVVFR